MGDVGDTFNAMKAHMKKKKARLGISCPDCTIKLPKAQPKILLPNQRCWCGYRDPRQRENDDVK